jgi:hypothetical protein
MAPPSAFRASRAIGAMFFSLLGGAWVALWSVRAFGVRPLLLAIIAACSLAIFYGAIRLYQANQSTQLQDAESPEKKRRDQIFHLVNAGQWVLILIVGNVLVNLGRSQWVIMAAILIIGLHFLPLAWLFAYVPHYVTGTALVLWAIGFPVLSKAGPGAPIGCLGAGVILWTSALYALNAKPAAP